MIVARSAGWSSARPACGTRSLHRRDRASRPGRRPPSRCSARRSGSFEVARDRPERALDAEPAEEPGRANVDRDQAERALDVVEADVVDADDAPAVDVDDLLVHQVRAEQDLVGALLELVDVQRRRAQPRAASTSSDSTDDQGRKIWRPSVADDQPGDRRIALADGDDQVGDLADRVAVLVADGPADDLAQVEHFDTSTGGRPEEALDALLSEHLPVDGTDRY